MFYTAMYRTLINPHSWAECSEYDQTNNCSVGKLVHRSPYVSFGANDSIRPGQMFVDEGTWDNFHTKYPFYALTLPDVHTKLIQGIMNTYHEGGWLS